MSSWRNVVPHGAVALSAILCAAAPASAGDILVNLSWQFYQGGLAQQDDDSFILEQDTYNNLVFNEVTRTLGGSTFTSVAAIANSTLLETGKMVVTSAITMNAHASTPASLPDGMAEAFAGLSIYDISFHIMGTAQIYTGVEVLMGDEGAYPSGSVLEPGFYSFLYFEPFALDAHVESGPGETSSEEKFRNFRFEFRPVPAPAAAALLPLAGLAAARRRRR